MARPKYDREKVKPGIVAGQRDEFFMFCCECFLWIAITQVGKNWGKSQEVETCWLPNGMKSALNRLVCLSVNNSCRGPLSELVIDLLCNC